MFAANLLSRFLNNPTKKLLGTAKRVLMFIQWAIDFEIEYVKGKYAFVYYDSDWSGDENDMKNTSKYIFSFGNSIFSWASVKQHSVAFLIVEYDYVSASNATTQAIWLGFVLEEFGEIQTYATTLYCDNISAIAKIRNPVFHQRSKHINRRSHYIKNALQENIIESMYCKSKEQLPDIFTKVLPKDQFYYLRGLLGVKSTTSLERSVEM